MNKFMILFLILLITLLCFSLLMNSNFADGLKDDSLHKDGFTNYQIFMDNIKEVIFDVTTPYPEEILQKDIVDPLQNFCNIYGSSDSTCNNLTNDNCKSSSCCVLLNTKSNSKCVGGSERGPTFKSDADSYYYMNKLYSNTISI